MIPGVAPEFVTCQVRAARPLDAPWNDYRFLPGGVTDLAGGTTDPAGTGAFLFCLGFLVSLLLRWWPLGI